MIHTIGIDIGSGVVKTTLFRTEGSGADAKSEWLARRCERIRRRDNMQLAKDGYDEVLEEAGLQYTKICTRPLKKIYHNIISLICRYAIIKWMKYS